MERQTVHDEREAQNDAGVLTFCPYGSQDMCRDKRRCPEVIESCDKYQQLNQGVKYNLRGNK